MVLCVLRICICYSTTLVLVGHVHRHRYTVSPSPAGEGLYSCVVSSVANTAAKPWNWANFDTVLTHKNYEKQVRCGLAKYQLHVSLWALIWRRGLRGTFNFLLATLVVRHYASVNA